jgi:ATP-dependent helicase HrpA
MTDESIFPPHAELELCLLADRKALQKRLRGLKRRRKTGQPFDQGLARLRQDIDRSKQIVSKRQASSQKISYPAELPVSQRLHEIQELISKHQVIILCGETGSGKSTQLPKICLSLGLGVFGRIGHTQPRRIAARSLMSRISTELDSPAGEVVGYKVRFKDHVRLHTRVKLMTDGILLNEIQQDPWLHEYDTLIIDEAHERSLNIDFLLGYLQQLLPRRPDLKVIITSATIDPERFSKHFNDAPILEVTGRTYPVEVRYQPPQEEGASERDESMQQAILDAVDDLSSESRGDILVFLSGEREIRETAEHLHKHRLQLTEILPLYARLSPADQAKIFRTSSSRRIILATNVAETSLTVPGVRHVIDAGFARISRYSHRSKVQRLPVERVSQASANQRKGRCGRVAEGICIRLYSEEDFDARREFIEPEIQRTNLASVILQMKLLHFADIEQFPFIDPPHPRLVSDGYKLLEEVLAVDAQRNVTRLGRQMAKTPVDPRIARMLLEAAHTHCLRELLVIAAALSVQDPRDRPLEKQQAADEAHALFHHPESDFLGYVTLWDHLEEQRRHLSRRKFHNHCRSRFLSPTRVQEWHDIHQQLRAQMHQLKYKENQKDAGYEAVHKAILSGLLSHIGFRESGSDNDYKGARGSRFYLFPGSVLFKSKPKWVMAAELVETTRLYARIAAKIEPRWIESMAGHLLKRSYSEPHWQQRRGQVGGWEKVMLYGLTLVARRRVNYGPINPEESREIFIRFALVEGDFHSRAPFWRHNKELIEDLRAQEAKSRSFDILVDEQVLYEFYAARIPQGIYSTAQFEKWLRKATGNEPKLLHMRRQDLLRDDASQVSQELYPDELEVNGMRLPLQYHFEPGQAADGVTLVAPQEVLSQISDENLQWLVPGMLQERIVMLLRGLPKSLRRHFVPIPDTAARLLEEIADSDAPLLQAVGQHLQRMGGVYIPEDAWQDNSLPSHLRMNVRVLDGKGAFLGEGRDLAALKKKYALQGGAGRTSLPAHNIEREKIIRWNFDELPHQVTVKRAGIELKGFPALVDDGNSVAIRVLDSQVTAQQAHHAGLRRLIMLTLHEQMRYLRKQLPHLNQMRLQYAKAVKPADLKAAVSLEEELLTLIIDTTFLADNPDIRSRPAFEELIGKYKGDLMEFGNSSCQLVAEILTLYQQVRKTLAVTTAINYLTSIKDIQPQLDQLVYQGFLQHTEWRHLQRYPAYLKAMILRLDKLKHALQRDQQQMREMAAFLQQWRQRYERMQQRRQYDERLDEMRWSIEELRISLFAQEVKTAYPVSLKRLQQRWQKLGL